MPSGERLSREQPRRYAARRSVEPSIFRLARRLYDAGRSPAFRSRNWAPPLHWGIARFVTGSDVQYGYTAPRPATWRAH